MNHKLLNLPPTIEIEELKGLYERRQSPPAPKNSILLDHQFRLFKRKLRYFKREPSAKEKQLKPDACLKFDEDWHKYIKKCKTIDMNGELVTQHGSNLTGDNESQLGDGQIQLDSEIPNDRF